eukprot:3370407-Karenia_brevis.AAC.1
MELLSLQGIERSFLALVHNSVLSFELVQRHGMTTCLPLDPRRLVTSLQPGWHWGRTFPFNPSH